MHAFPLVFSVILQGAYFYSHLFDGKPRLTDLGEPAEVS